MIETLIIDGITYLPTYTYDNFYVDENGQQVYEGLVITKTAIQEYEERMFSKNVCESNNKDVVLLDKVTSLEDKVAQLERTLNSLVESITQ